MHIEAREQNGREGGVLRNSRMRFQKEKKNPRITNDLKEEILQGS